MNSKLCAHPISSPSCLLPTWSVEAPGMLHSAPLTTRPFGVRSHPCPQNMGHYSNTNSKTTLQSGRWQSVKTRMPHLRQFCRGGRQQRATKLLLRPNSCWKRWCRKHSGDTVNLVYPSLHFLRTPRRHRNMYVRVFPHLSAWHPAHFSLLI